MYKSVLLSKTNLGVSGIQMIVTLPTEIEKIVAEKISSGAYQSADEVISKSVRLLEAKEKGIEALRREIMRGFEDIQEGRYRTCLQFNGKSFLL